MRVFKYKIDGYQFLLLCAYITAWLLPIILSWFVINIFDTPVSLVGMEWQDKNVTLIGLIILLTFFTSLAVGFVAIVILNKALD